MYTSICNESLHISYHIIFVMILHMQIYVYIRVHSWYFRGCALYQPDNFFLNYNFLRYSWHNICKFLGSCQFPTRDLYRHNDNIRDNYYHRIRLIIIIHTKSKVIMIYVLPYNSHVKWKNHMTYMTSNIN